MTLEDTLRAIVREEVRAALRDAASPTAPTGDVLTLDEAATHANVSKATLHRWMRDGLVTRRGHGRLTRVSRAQVDAALANGGTVAQVRDPVAIGLALARGR